MALESQAEALTQLSIDDLEGKVVSIFKTQYSIYEIFIQSSFLAVCNSGELISWWWSCTVKKRTFWEPSGTVFCLFFLLKHMLMHEFSLVESHFFKMSYEFCLRWVLVLPSQWIKLPFLVTVLIISKIYIPFT